MWNSPNGTPFNKDQPFVMAHHRIHVPKIRANSKGSSGLMVIANCMNRPDQRPLWDTGIERLEELYRVDEHL